MITFSKNQAKITFYNSLYSPDVIKKAVNDFSKSCEIKFLKEAVLSYVTITAKQNTLKNLTYEFCNHALALMKDTFVETARYVKNEG